MVQFPEIKKKISGFLLSEEGEISKTALVGLGVVAGGIGINVVKAGHGSDTVAYNNSKYITGVHSSHNSHDQGSHSSSGGGGQGGGSCTCNGQAGSGGCSYN